MPFTFSHPAIVLPFSKIRHDAISMSGLVIGSITPDFEYFIRMKLAGRYSHSVEGMFLLDLPIAFIIAIVFHQLVKKPLIDNLPIYFHSRLISLREFNFPQYLKKHFSGFLVCLLLGISSHILWDSFTHANAYFVESIEYLSTPISPDGLPLFRYLQHASTVLGAIVIIVVFHRQPISQSLNKLSVSYWLVLISIASLIFAIRSYWLFRGMGDIVVSTIASLFIGIIISSIIFLQRIVK